MPASSPNLTPAIDPSAQRKRQRQTMARLALSCWHIPCVCFLPPQRSYQPLARMIDALTEIGMETMVTSLIICTHRFDPAGQP